MKMTPEQLEAVKKDSQYHDLGVLPSQGIPYKDPKFQIYVRTFRLAELKLLSRAVELGEVEHLIRAVDNSISVPAESLTIGDFFYVMLWLRLYSIPKSPYIVEWRCEQPYFTAKEDGKPLFYTDDNWPSVEELREKYNVSPCSTENTNTVHQTDTEIISLDENFTLPQPFDFPRMSCYVGRSAALKDPDFAHLAPAIQWMPGDTWEAKVAYADEHPELFGEALDLNREVVHGIKETVTFNCRKCRVEHTTKLELNALSFFR